jgi:outer membrane protein
MKDPRRAMKGLLAAVCASVVLWPAAPEASGPGAAPGDPMLSVPPAGDTLRLSLQSAIDRARAASHRLAALDAQRDAAGAALGATRAGRWPQIDLTAGYTRYSDVPEFTIALPGGPRETLFPNLPDNYRSRIGASLPIFTGGRLGRSIAASRYEEAASALDRSSGEADLVLEVTAAYWSLLTSRENEQVLGEALRAYESHLRDARNRRETGLAAANEVLAIEVERDRAELGRLQASAVTITANADLLRLLDLNESTVIVETDTTGAATSAVSEPADSAFARTPPNAPAATAGTGPDSLTQALIRQALRARPERAALAARVAAARARISAEQGARWPQLNAAAGYDYSRPNRRITPPVDKWKDTWDASVNLGFNVFDGGRTSSAVARARAMATSLEEQLADLDARIRLEVRTRALALRTAERALEVARRASAAAGENRKVAGDRYREGVGSSSDLLDAEVGWLRAGLDLTDAEVRVRLARAQLARSTGSLE